MVRKKELVRQLEEVRAVNAELRAERREYYYALFPAPYAVRSGYGLGDYIGYSTPDDVNRVVERLVADVDVARAERDLYRNAFILAAHTEAIRSAASPKDVERAKKAHRKAGAPRIAYDDTTGATRLLYPAPPEKSPLEAS
jgi:hypothetical protein